MIVRGGRRLAGTVNVPAAKNSVLPLLAATLLCEGKVRLCGVPRLSDVEVSLALLRAVGAECTRRGDDVEVEAAPRTCRLPERETAQMRASILFAAPLLARQGRVEMGLPGGCPLGARPIDLHLQGLACLGVREQRAGDGRLILTAPRGLHGAAVRLRLPSVGATETILLAAASAQGSTVLYGAAQEPEIVDLARFLNACGASVRGAGSPVIRISGCRTLRGTAYTPMPDRIYASTLACAAAAAGGEVCIRGCAAALYAPLLRLLQRAGCRVTAEGSAATVRRDGVLNGLGWVRTGVYPGFATDAAPLLAGALLAARGVTRIEDTIFEKRFACARGFAQMGAAAAVEGSALLLCPAAHLHPAAVRGEDLRGGAALAVAALGIEGESTIAGAALIRRGYEDFCGALRELGAEAECRTAKKTRHFS